jgi:hypothetical protein
MYFGHRTNRVKSRFGWRSWPIPKFLLRFSKSGLSAFFLATRLPIGAAAGRFPFRTILGEKNYVSVFSKSKK